MVAGWAADLLQVGSRTEGPTLAEKHRDGRVLVGVKAAERVREQSRRWSVHRVATLWSREHHGPDRTIALDPNRVSHGSPQALADGYDPGPSRRGRIRPVDDRRRIHTGWQRPIGTTSLATEPRGAESIRHRRGGMTDEQRSLQRQREVLDQAAGGELFGADQAGPQR